MWAILALAFVLRIVGIQFGLPHLYHADEPIVVNHAVAYGTGDFNPHFFKLPPLTSYLLFFFYGLLYLFARTFGVFGAVNDYEKLFFSNPTFFFLSGRIAFGAFLGTAGVCLLYRLIQRYFSEGRALLSAFFLACTFLHVRDSHYIYPDIPLLFVLTASFFPILSMGEKEGGWRQHLTFGALAGLAVGTKYNGIVILVPYLTSQFLSPNGLRRFRQWLGAVGVSLLGYSLVNPYGWLDFGFFLKEISMQAQASGKTGIFHHFIYSLHGGIGTPLLIAGLLGLLLGVWQRERKRLVLASFLFSYYLLLVFRSQPYDRYVLPMVPFLLFFAADFLLFFTTLLVKGQRKTLVWLLALTLTTPTLVKSVLSDFLFLKKDVRTQAKEWIEASLPPDSKLALDWPFFMPRLNFSKAQLEKKLKESQSHPHFSKVQQRRIEILLSGEGSQKKRFRLYFLSEDPAGTPFLFARPTLPYDWGALRQEGIEYVLIARVEEEYKYSEFYHQLKKEAHRVKRFTPYRDRNREYPFDPQPLTGGPFLWRELISRERNGQPLELYRLK